MQAGPTIRTPTERICEVCGRRERWESVAESWVIDSERGEEAVGDPHCIHEWDINGTFAPYE